MSETFTTSSESPSTHESHLDEVTRDEVLSADAEQLVAAANMDIARIQSLISEVEHGGIEWNKLREQLASAGQVAQHARQYKNSSRLSGAESFSQFLNDNMSDADEVDDLDELEAYQQTEDWMLKQADLSDGGMIGDVLRTERQMLEETEPRQADSPAVVESAETFEQPANQTSAEAEARNSVECIFEDELFEDIVKLGKNRTQLHTDVKGGFKYIGDGPQGQRSLLKHESFMQMYARENPASNWREELNEFAMFTDVVEREYRQVTVPHETKGRFGRTIRTESTRNEVISGSERPKMIRNESTGQDEPLVVFAYKFNLRSKHAQRAESKGELPSYREFYGNRSGQIVEAGLELPKSIADTLRERIRADPTIVRSLVEKLFLENSSGQMSEQSWHQGSEDSQHPVRPPYEQLPSDWNIALITNSKGGNDNSYAVERLAA